MERLAVDPLALDVIAFVVGLLVGSFLNVLSLRTLKGESVIWPLSHCPQCHKSLPVWDNIPLLSYIFLRGQCRFCKVPISWQYPAVELFTGISFLVLVHAFGLSWHTAGMAFFVATLIAVTVTDIREKLIPHDITYPAMLVGIFFSSFVRKDLLGAMAGIGASYILFDFLAHYGLKLYTRYHSGDQESEEDRESEDAEIDEEFGIASDEGAAGDEEIEVMGGGDAVLSAVIAAYLGWERLLAALMVGFVVGTVMGVMLLIVEMRKANILSEVVKPLATGVVLGFALLGATTYMFSLATGSVSSGLPWLQFGLLGAFGGGLLGIVSVGTRVSKPFPFGPALAIGGMTAIFWDPIGSLLNGGA